jgi:hypothetical protein
MAKRRACGKGRVEKAKAAARAAPVAARRRVRSTRGIEEGREETHGSVHLSLR